jgi:hypothetical protein
MVRCKVGTGTLRLLYLLRPAVTKRMAMVVLEHHLLRLLRLRVVVIHPMEYTIPCNIPKLTILSTAMSYLVPFLCHCLHMQ